MIGSMSATTLVYVQISTKSSRMVSQPSLLPIRNIMAHWTSRYDYKFSFSHRYNWLYLYQIPVDDDLFDEMEAKYAPSEHAVFELVPKAFEDRAELFYSNIGQPAVSFATFWDIYKDILAEFEHHDETEVEFSSMLRTQGSIEHAVSEEVLDVLPGMRQYSLTANKEAIADPETADGAVMEYCLSDDEDNDMDSDHDNDNDCTLEVELTATVDSDRTTRMDGWIAAYGYQGATLQVSGSYWIGFL